MAEEKDHPKKAEPEASGPPEIHPLQVDVSSVAVDRLRAAHADSDIVFGSELIRIIVTAKICVFQAVYVELGIRRPQVGALSYN